MSSICELSGSLTSSIPANATFAGKKLLKDSTAAAARSRYLVSPVARQA
jgi:hypothetical protein